MTSRFGKGISHKAIFAGAAILSVVLLFAVVLSAVTPTAANPQTSLSEEDLLNAGLEALQYEGLQNVDTPDELVNRQSRLVTYRQWLDFAKHDMDEATLKTLGWSFDMPVFIIAAEGDVILRKPGPPPGDGIKPRREFSKILVAIHGVSGDLMATFTYPDDKPLPDLSAIQ